MRRLLGNRAGAAGLAGLAAGVLALAVGARGVWVEERMEDRVAFLVSGLLGGAALALVGLHWALGSWWRAERARLDEAQMAIRARRPGATR